jgi:hypothetical protein
LLEVQSITVRQALLTSSLEGYPRSFPDTRDIITWFKAPAPFSKVRYPFAPRKLLLSTLLYGLRLPAIYVSLLRDYVELLSIGLTFVCGFPYISSLPAIFNTIFKQLLLSSRLFLHCYVKHEICKLYPSRISDLAVQVLVIWAHSHINSGGILTLRTPTTGFNPSM